MVRRVSQQDSPCPVARSLDGIGDGWSLLIVRDALAGLTRFGEFQRSLGVAKNILAARLKSLVEQGVLRQVPAADGSAFLDYRLTEKGRALLPVLAALGQWGNTFLFPPGQSGTTLVDRAEGKPIRPLELRAADGRLLGLEDIVARQGDEVRGDDATKLSAG